MTVIDVMNTNKRLRQDEGSGTESSRSNGWDSFGEGESSPETIKIIELTMPDGRFERQSKYTKTKLLVINLVNIVIKKTRGWGNLVKKLKNQKSGDSKLENPIAKPTSTHPKINILVGDLKIFWFIMTQLPTRKRKQPTAQHKLYK